MTRKKKTEAKEWTYSSYHGRMGRSSIMITCPWCGTVVEAFCWSLAGSGKRCPECKAIHRWWFRMSEREAKEASDKEEEVQ